MVTGGRQRVNLIKVFKNYFKNMIRVSNTKFESRPEVINTTLFHAQLS